MAIKTINGILKEDSTATVDEFNTRIKDACNNAETVDSTNKYVGLVFNLKDKKIDFVPSNSVENDFNINSTTIIDNTNSNVDISYVRTTGIPSKVGGAESGTTFDGTVADALDKILYPFVKPTFQTFYLSSQITTLEVGDKITGGNRTFTWSTNTSENIEPNTIKIVSGYTTLAENLADDGSEDINIGDDIVKTEPGTHYFKIYATDKESNTLSKYFGCYWKWRLYYGSSPLETLTQSDVKALQNSFLYSSENYTYNTPENNYKWICYPKSFGLASKFTDMGTGFSVAMEAPQEISITNAFNVTTDYYCYRTTNSMANAVRIKIG